MRTMAHRQTLLAPANNAKVLNKDVEQCVVLRVCAWK